jgi:hypothetical protein
MILNAVLSVVKVKKNAPAGCSRTPRRLAVNDEQ